MPPLSSVITETSVLDKVNEASCRKEKPVLEERRIHISITKIINDIRGVDYSKVVWRNAIFFLLLQLSGLYGVYLIVTVCQWKTFFFAYTLANIGGLGITMGAHRLWAHKTYKAKLPLRIFLAFAQTVAIQNHIYEWSRDHRVHHKFTETDADPHNANRGFFFCHMGWLMTKKHPDVIEKGKTVDMSDLLEDPVVYYQRKFYKPLAIFFGIFLPVYIPYYFWDENLNTAIMVAFCYRYFLSLHFTWVVNSLAHWVGSKPFDKNIHPTENAFVSYLAMGEGWHNYHHVFPYDYRTAEIGVPFGLNLTTGAIDLFAKIGWAYDRKTVPKELIAQRAARTGDGSFENKEHQH